MTDQRPPTTGPGSVAATSPGKDCEAVTPLPHDQQSLGLEQRDGCGCPPWVVRCAHYERQGLWLTGPFKGTYGVHGPAPEPIGLNCHNCFNAGSDPAAAEAEFFRREAELLQREPEP